MIRKSVWFHKAWKTLTLCKERQNLNELTAICAVAETEEATHRPHGFTTVLQHQTYNVETVTVKWVIMRGQICEPPGSQKLRLSSALVPKIICYDKNIMQSVGSK